jgi:hypothetical protein
VTGQPASTPWGWRRVILAVGWAVAIAAPLWVVSALVLNAEAADIVGYAGATFGMAVGITRGGRAGTSSRRGPRP